MAEELTSAYVVGAVLAPDNSHAGTLAPAGVGGYRRIKRTIDRSLAFLLLVGCAVLMVVIALAIQLDSPGPALFKQQRIGFLGRRFTIYKFRTMSVLAPAYSYKVSRGDPMITRVGRWLRSSGLDELPQLVNVLKGDMSMIGPRPELPFIVDEFLPWQHARHLVKPGITGWWQIHNRNEVPLHFHVDYDIYYLRNLSFKLDCAIAWRTLKVILAGLVPAGRRTSLPS